MINEEIPKYIGYLIFIVAVASLYIKYKKESVQKKKETEELIKNTDPTNVELYDVIAYTQHSRDSDGSCTMIRLAPVFKNTRTKQIYVNATFYDLGDIKIKYVRNQSKEYVLEVKTKKGKIINENSPGNIYIKHTIGNVTYSDNIIDIGNGRYKYDGKLKNYDDLFNTKVDTLFNIMKNDFIEEMLNATIVDTHIDFDMDDKANINPYV